MSTYEIRNCWKARKDGAGLAFEAVDTVVAGELQPLKGRQRTAPIMLGRPRTVSHSVRMIMPDEWHGEGWRQDQQVFGMLYRSGFSIDGLFIKFFKELQINAWSIPAQEADGYRTMTDRIRENVLSIWAREERGKIKSLDVPSGKSDFFAIFWLIWVIVIIGGVLLRALK